MEGRTEERRMEDGPDKHYMSQPNTWQGMKIQVIKLKIYLHYHVQAVFCETLFISK